MSDHLKAGKAVGKPVAINEAAIRERIAKNAGPVAEWTAACLVMDASASVMIGELYGHYEGYCRREKHPAIARKTWIGTMKLAGFHTESGAFARLRIQ